MIRRPPRSTLFPTRRSSDLGSHTLEVDATDSGGNVGRASYTWTVDVTAPSVGISSRSEEHTSELQSQFHLVCRLLLEKKKYKKDTLLLLAQQISASAIRVAP